VSPLVVSGPLTPAELGALCERVRALDRGSGDALVCEVGAVTTPDAGTVDTLARLGLTARRAGRELRLRHPSPALCELLDLCGLAGVLGVEPRRQPEQREQALGVEERVEMGDPPVL
jgi:ABC-type transporter Mla MlaB component